MQSGTAFLIDDQEQVWGCTDPNLTISRTVDSGKVPVKLSDVVLQKMFYLTLQIDMKAVSVANSFIGRKFGSWQNAAATKYTGWASSEGTVVLCT